MLYDSFLNLYIIIISALPAQGIEIETLLTFFNYKNLHNVDYLFYICAKI